MGPDSTCLAFARFLIAAHPNLGISEIDLGYAIQYWIDANWDQIFSEQTIRCNALAHEIKQSFPSILDSEALIAITIQDFIDKLKADDTESE